MDSTWAMSMSDSTEDVQVARYLLVATTGAWIWDVLTTLTDDIRVYSTSSLKPPDMGHLLSRLAAACYISASLAFSIASVDDCKSLGRVVGWTGAITLPLHTIPFFFCARAIFFRTPKIIAAFAVMWLGTLGANLSTPFFLRGGRLEDTKSCVAHLDRPFATGIVAVAIHNSIIFVSASISLMTYTGEDAWPRRVKAFLHRRGISNLARMLMQSGQSHIIPIVIFNIVAATINLIPSVPASYKTTFVVMNVALQNAMTARIHRLIKSGAIADHPTMDMNATTALDPTILDLRGMDGGRLTVSAVDGSYVSESRPGQEDVESAHLGFDKEVER